jgi:hypothetical protein|tara:strand:- start:20646 stop:21647 length:1002 start_codon:yes stop_codon:yes gene_type:complete
MIREAKKLVAQYHKEMDDTKIMNTNAVMRKFLAYDCKFYGVHPFNDLLGPDQISEAVYSPLRSAWEPIQRRQDIFIAGENELDGSCWVMSMGHYMGLFKNPWLDIQPTNRMCFLRYSEFYQILDGKISSIAFFCDLIGVMKQAGYDPLPPQTGASFICPGPKTNDGIILADVPEVESKKTLDLVNRMVQDLEVLNQSGNDNCPPSYLAKTWHNDMVWFGPEGIGGSYTINSYQQQHQYPFRQGLTDKTFNAHVCRFAEGNYACFFGWPNLFNRPKGGFLGLPTSGIQAEMRVVDVFRRSGEKLAENWVFIDFPHWLHQQGLDIFARMKKVVNR